MCVCVVGAACELCVYLERFDDCDKKEEKREQDHRESRLYSRVLFRANHDERQRSSHHHQHRAEEGPHEAEPHVQGRERTRIRDGENSPQLLASRVIRDVADKMIELEHLAQRHSQQSEGRRNRHNGDANDAHPHHREMTRLVVAVILSMRKFQNSKCIETKPSSHTLRVD